jgi:pimeloyl-ACP methyl ester carboxylesterase
VTQANATAGYFRSGLPYNRIGHGPRNLVVLQGLVFENKPLAGLMLPVFSGMYRFLGEDYTIYIVARKPGLPNGYTLQNMSDDYAAMIRQEFGGPVDVIGVSTGGSIAQHFAADHPDLVRRLIIHSSAHTLSDAAKDVQMRVGHLARHRQWRAAHRALLSFMAPRSGVMKYVARQVVWLGSLMGGMILGAPEDPSDLVVTIEAEDQHSFKDRLGQISTSTLVVAGDTDPFYSEQLFRETAEGIPNAKLILYEGMGHPASGKQFRQDVLAFLRAGMTEDA